MFPLKPETRGGMRTIIAFIQCCTENSNQCNITRKSERDKERKGKIKTLIVI